MSAAESTDLPVNVLPEDGIEDMRLLTHLHEAAIVHNLSHRLQRRHVYTDVGQITIAVNPFCWKTSKPLYEPELRRRYRREDAGPLPPHLFALAERTHREVRRGACDQTVLVSGESGAGKTESVKLIMHYLSSSREDAQAAAESGELGAGALESPPASPASRQSVAERVLATNPLLEAFGNAATQRNANSSRFGKFILLRFADRGSSICGATIQVYLLEKSRVVRRQRGERSYHVFYQMLHGASATEMDEPCGHAYAGTFAYLTDAEATAAAAPATAPAAAASADGGANDAAGLERTRRAMFAVGLSEDSCACVWRTLSAILLLGQLQFEPASSAPASASGLASPSGGAEPGGSGDDDGRCIVSTRCTLAVGRVAELLGVASADDLSRGLCTRRLVTREEEVTVHLTPAQALDSRDALAKALYGRLFGWCASARAGRKS